LEVRVVVQNFARMLRVPMRWQRREILDRRRVGMRAVVKDDVRRQVHHGRIARPAHGHAEGIGHRTQVCSNEPVRGFSVGDCEREAREPDAATEIAACVVPLNPVPAPLSTAAWMSKIAVPVTKPDVRGELQPCPTSATVMKLPLLIAVVPSYWNSVPLMLLILKCVTSLPSTALMAMTRPLVVCVSGTVVALVTEGEVRHGIDRDRDADGAALQIVYGTGRRLRTEAEAGGVAVIGIGIRSETGPAKPSPFGDVFTGGDQADAGEPFFVEPADEACDPVMRRRSPSALLAVMTRPLVV